MTPRIHIFPSTGEAYDASQCDDGIHDGDILSVPSEHVVGILLEAWPTAITEETGEFHTPVDLNWAAVPQTTWDNSKPPPVKDYTASHEAAVAELARLS